MATREEKVRKKQERSLRRIQKRIKKDKEYMKHAFLDDLPGISFARRVYNGTQHICEMRYSECELRGYCNGDC